MFNIGDTVLYAAYGVCRVEELTSQPFKGKMIDYYLLRPVHNNRMTYYVPVGNAVMEARMRRILSVEEIHELIKIMPDTNGVWIKDDTERKKHFTEILAGGSREEIVKLIKILHQHELERKAEGKKLYLSDEHTLHEAEKLLYDEFAYVLNITPDQVVPFITQQIEVEEK